MNYLMRTHNDSHEFLLIHAVRNVFTTRFSNICNGIRINLTLWLYNITCQWITWWEHTMIRMNSSWSMLCGTCSLRGPAIFATHGCVRRLKTLSPSCPCIASCQSVDPRRHYKCMSVMIPGSVTTIGMTVL